MTKFIARSAPQVVELIASRTTGCFARHESIRSSSLTPQSLFSLSPPPQSILALSSRFGIGFGFMSGILLPLIGLSSLGTRSGFLLKLYSILCASISLSTVISGIVLLSLARGDPPGCYCDPLCAFDLGVGAGDEWCRHLTLARAIFWTSALLGFAMVLLQGASCWAAWDLSEDTAFLDSITVAVTEPLAPGPLTPIVRRTAGYTYAVGTWGEPGGADAAAAMAAVKKRAAPSSTSHAPLPPASEQRAGETD